MTLRTNNVDQNPQTVSTTTVKIVDPNTKRGRTQMLQVTHNAMFHREGVTYPKFSARMCLSHRGEPVVTFYERDLFGGKDVYFELCKKDWSPQDPQRILLKWIYNNEFQTEYAKTGPHPVTKETLYIVPLGEMVNVTSSYSDVTAQDFVPLQAVYGDIVVTEEPVKKIKELPTSPAPAKTPKVKEPAAAKEVFELIEDEGAGTDVPFSAMSLRDYAAIKLNKPVSHKKWLNEIINKKFN